MNLIQQLEAEAIAGSGKNIPEFRPGDTLRVGVKVVEGERTRVQAYEGVCIARSNKGMGSSFTVRKISFGEGVERVFPLYSPNIDSIEVVRKGAVRRAKLYYLRGRTGKRARIEGVEVAGKSGTAEHGEGRNPHAWFMSFAPADDPKIAVAVVVEDGGNAGSEAAGGRISAPIARDVMRAVIAP